MIRLYWTLLAFFITLEDNWRELFLFGGLGLTFILWYNGK